MHESVLDPLRANSLCFFIYMFNLTSTCTAALLLRTCLTPYLNSRFARYWSCCNLQCFHYNRRLSPSMTMKPKSSRIVNAIIACLECHDSQGKLSMIDKQYLAII